MKKLSGPFGYEMGQAISGEPDGQTDSGFLYQFSPKEFTGWAWVVAEYTHQTGVYAVTALKLVEDGDDYGLAHRAAADSLVEILTKKYGAFEKADFLRTGSIWDEPNEWLMGISENERLYAYEKEGAIEGNLERIYVSVRDNGIGLHYFFNNYDAGKEAASEVVLSVL